MTRYSIALIWLLCFTFSIFAATPIESKWVNEFNVQHAVLGAPIISTAGIIYVGAGTSLWAIDLAKGTKKWEYLLHSSYAFAEIQASPALTPDENTIYVTANFPSTTGIKTDHAPMIEAISVNSQENPQLIWTQSTSSIGPGSDDSYLINGPAVDPGNKTIWIETIVAKHWWTFTPKKLFYQLEPDGSYHEIYIIIPTMGTKAFVTPTEGIYAPASPSAFAQSAPAIGKDGNMVAVSDTYFVKKVSFFSPRLPFGNPGLFSWRSPRLTTPLSAPALDLTNDWIYVGGQNGNLYLYDSIRPHFQRTLTLGTDLSQGVPVVVNRILYISGTNGYLYAITFDGTQFIQKWSCLLSNSSLFVHRPAFDNEHNIIYLVDQYGGLFAVKDQGDTATLLWSVNVSANTAPAVAPDPDKPGNSIVVVGTNHGTLKAFVGAL